MEITKNLIQPRITDVFLDPCLGLDDEFSIHSASKCSNLSETWTVDTSAKVIRFLDDRDNSGTLFGALRFVKCQ